MTSALEVGCTLGMKEDRELCGFPVYTSRWLSVTSSPIPVPARGPGHLLEPTLLALAPCLS